MTDTAATSMKDWRSGIEACIRRLEAQMEKPRDLWHAAYFAALDEALIHLRAMLERGTERSGDCLVTAAYDKATADRLCRELRAEAARTPLAAHRAEIADQLEAAGAEVERLTGCMNTAGLQCFMRGSSPAKVAEHMRSVAESWTKHDAEVTAERDALRAEVERLTNERDAADRAYRSKLDDLNFQCDLRKLTEADRDALRVEVERLTAVQPNWSHEEALAQRDALIALDVGNRARHRELEAEVARWKSARDECERQFQDKVREIATLMNDLDEARARVVELEGSKP